MASAIWRWNCFWIDVFILRKAFYFLLLWFLDFLLYLIFHILPQSANYLNDYERLSELLPHATAVASFLVVSLAFVCVCVWVCSSNLLTHTLPGMSSLRAIVCYATVNQAKPTERMSDLFPHTFLLSLPLSLTHAIFYSKWIAICTIYGYYFFTITHRINLYTYLLLLHKIFWYLD